MDVQPKKPTTKGPAEWFTGDVWIVRATCTTRRTATSTGTVRPTTIS